jgi:hypothetical protein
MKSEIFTMRTPAWLVKAIKEHAKEKGVSSAELVRDVLKAYLIKEEAKSQ